MAAHPTRSPVALRRNNTEAERLLNEALTRVPELPLRVGTAGKGARQPGPACRRRRPVRATLRRRAHPENLFELARALDRAGRRSEARTAYATFEAAGARESEKWDNANRELVSYFVDVAKRPDEALRVASLEFARRQDVYTLDAYAWALYANKRTGEARDVMGRALAVGIKKSRRPCSRDDHRQELRPRRRRAIATFRAR